jgi:pimeloyl-ACP methyl ester carboxylesterase
MHFKDHYIDVKDVFGETVTFRYWDEGSGETVILLHGIGVSAEIWHQNVEYLSKSYRVIVPDALGHGKSSRSANNNLYNMKNMTIAFAKFVDALGLEAKFHLAGNSVGGMQVIEYSLNYQQNLKSMCLISAAGLGKDIGITYRMSTLPYLGELFFKNVNKLGVRMFFESMIENMDHVGQELINRTYSYLRVDGTSKAVLGSMRAEATMRGMTFPYSKQQLSTIKCPTLIVWGKNDPAVPLSHANFGLAAIPNSTLIVFKNAKHASQLERFNEFNSKYEKFLSNPEDYVLSQRKQSIEID